MNTKYFWLYGQAKTTYCIKCLSTIPAGYNLMSSVFDMCKACDIDSLRWLCADCAGSVMHNRHKLMGLIE